MAKQKSNHWISKTADRVAQRVAREKGEGARIVCASGISPSGHIHLGNLRELMTVHLVVDELKRRGHEAEHIHSWDDYDRLRKVPKGIPEEFSRYIGCPLADVPDPHGEYGSWAERFMDELVKAVERLGVHPRYVRQSEAYRRGDYNDLIKLAMERRGECFDILARYQTHELHEKPVDERRAAYYPFRVYCEACGKDETRILAYDRDSARIEYTCDACGHASSFSLDEKVSGKLVWKIDWPMRWFFEKVDFEPGGEDHSTPGSSFTVGQDVVREIFDYRPPHYEGYAFVGMSGRTKMSSSAGDVGTPEAALDVYEPPMLRWFYIRRQPGKAFSIEFDDAVIRTYDEWDALVRKNRAGKALPADAFIYERATATAEAEVPGSEPLASFRLLSSAADLTQGARGQILRIAAQTLDEAPPEGVLESSISGRVDCAINWATRYLPDENRTQVNASFDAAAWGSLDEEQREAVAMLVDGMSGYWSFNGLTTWIYGVPKLLCGLPLDHGPTDELKKRQRAFFIAIYRLVVGSETGPRLPTLFLSLGEDRIRSLLSPPG